MFGERWDAIKEETWRGREEEKQGRWGQGRWKKGDEGNGETAEVKKGCSSLFSWSNLRDKQGKIVYKGTH